MWLNLSLGWSSLRVDGVDVAPSTLSSANAPGRERWCFLSNQASFAVSVGTHDRALAGRSVIFGPRVPGVRRESAARLWRCFEQAARGRPAEGAGKRGTGDAVIMERGLRPVPTDTGASGLSHETRDCKRRTVRRTVGMNQDSPRALRSPPPKATGASTLPTNEQRGAPRQRSLPRQPRPRSPRAGPAPRNLSRVNTGRRTSIAVS